MKALVLNVFLSLFFILNGVSASSTVDYVDCRKLTDAQITLLSTLQGLAARSERPFFLEIGTSGIWMKHLEKNKILFQEKKIDSIIDSYIQYASGYVLCDSNNIAVAVAASIPHNAVVVTPETEKIVISKGLINKLDVRMKDESWLWDYVTKNIGFYNLKGIVQPSGKKPYSMADYAILHKYIVINEKDNPELTKLFYGLIEPNSPRLGWGSPYGNEKKDVGLAGNYGMYTLPTGNTMNLSFFETLKSWKSSKMPLHSTKVPKANSNKHYVMIMMSDGDNINWHYSGLNSNGKYRDHPSANKYPISWMYPPLLKDISPVVDDYYQRTLPKSQSIIGGVSGAGYTFPSQHKDLMHYASLTNRKLKENGMEYLVIMDFLDFKTKQKTYLESMMQQMPDVKGLFYMDYGNYAKWKGDIYFINNKPVISFKYRLWKPMDPLEKIAESINSAPRNPYSADGYSAVVVHAWSYDMGDVEKFVKMLNPDVELINAEQMMKMISKNLKKNQ